MDQSATLPLLGLLGHRVAGNPMQFAMDQALRAAKLDWQFLSFDIAPELLADAIRGIDALGFRGLSVASPFTTQVQPYLTKSCPIASSTAWVDTLSRDETGDLVGHHLLGQALGELISEERLAGCQVGLLGNSPKTISLGKALLAQGAATLQAPDLDREQLARWNDPRVSNQLEDTDWSNLKVLIRGTSARAEDKAVPFDEFEIASLSSECVVVDAAIPASTSPLLRSAADQELTVFSSIDLMVHRALLALLLWTGKSVDPGPLREAFEEFLEI